MVLDKLAKDAKYYQERSTKWKLFFNIKELFVDVKYIYASTIHILQGSTYETVYIDLNEIEKMGDKNLMYRLLYVAITRASKDVKILLPDNDNIILSEHQDSILESLDKQLSILTLSI